MFKIKKIHHESMDMNTYLLIKQNQCIIIDPGLNGLAVKDLLSSKGLQINSVLLTHGHFDHIFSVDMLKDYLPFDIYIHKKDYPMLFDSELNYATAFGRDFKIDKSWNIHQLDDQDVLELLNEKISVIHTPGHTFGSVMFQYDLNIFSGDTLFYDSIGRTDLFSGNFNAIRRSINMIKNTLSNQCMIYPGHGRSGRLKDIKQTNRFFQS